MRQLNRSQAGSRYLNLQERFLGLINLSTTRVFFFFSGSPFWWTVKCVNCDRRFLLFFMSKTPETTEEIRTIRGANLLRRSEETSFYLWSTFVPLAGSQCSISASLDSSAVTNAWSNWSSWSKRLLIWRILPFPLWGTRITTAVMGPTSCSSWVEASRVSPEKDQKKIKNLPSLFEFCNKQVLRLTAS